MAKPRHHREFLDPGENPRVRIPHSSMSYFRIIEVLRYLYDHRSECRLDRDSVYRELQRRGALGPQHVIRSGNGSAPTDNAIVLVMESINFCVDMELIVRVIPREHIYRLTLDGKETLIDWDDSEQPGVWPR